jgi:phosphoenolpyruvate synthase/pyruvate phosphate dikinase
LGGKARGLAFLNHVLQKYNLYNEWEDVRVLVPRTMVITTDYFDAFIQENGLQYVINSQASDEEILSEFISSALPLELVKALQKFLDVVDKPLAIRSSSKLEDSYYQPFAGVYATYMIPNSPDKHQQLRLLAKAIKSVYASVYFSSSKGYILSTGNVIAEEKMAIVLQEICGSEQNGYFFPTMSGVARSVNFYPVNYERADEGIVKVAYGLGKVVVDGEPVLRFSPKYPKQALQLSSPDLTMRDTQRSMLALSMQPERFVMSVDEAVNMERLSVADCEQFESLKKIASTYDRDNMRIVDSCFPSGPRYITFAPQLKFNTFPLADIINRLLDIAQQEIKTPVEIEYAVDLMQSPAVFNVLQIRPISADSLTAKVDWDEVHESEKPLLKSESALGVGKIEGIRDIIYLRPEAFDVLHTREMALTMREWNSEIRNAKANYLLIGFGRWGSNIPTLGVPVQWGDISEAKAIVECSLPDFRIEPSQGSHFFQNLTSFNVGYINVDTIARPDECLDFAQLDALSAVAETKYLRHVRLEKPIEMYIDGFANKALVQFL